MEGVLNYEKIKNDAQYFYSNVHYVFCPAFNQKIQFTAEGFNHIVFKRQRLERDRSSQILRFKLLFLAVKLLKISTTFQEFEETIKEFQVMSYKKRFLKNKPVRYW